VPKDKLVYSCEVVTDADGIICLIPIFVSVARGDRAGLQGLQYLHTQPEEDIVAALLAK